MSKAIKYKFEYDNYSCHYSTWEEAADDAVRLGVGRWLNSYEFQLDYPASIKATRNE
jgi:hypothetical protein